MPPQPPFTSWRHQEYDHNAMLGRRIRGHLMAPPQLPAFAKFHNTSFHPMPSPTQYTMPEEDMFMFPPAAQWPRSSQQQQQQPRHPQLFKTTLCDFWIRHEPCRFGDRCWYAHGSAELRMSHENNIMRILNVDEHPPKRKKSKGHRILPPEDFDPKLADCFAGYAQWAGDEFAADDNHQKPEPPLSENCLNTSIGDCWPEVCRLVEDKLRVSQSQTQFDANAPAFKPKSELKTSSSVASLVSLVSETSDGHSIGSSGERDEKLWTVWNARIKECSVSESDVNLDEVCDLFAVSGACPLGDDCAFEHRTSF